jgi:DNA-binding transcriptional regulator YhcF (GntR family)
LYSFLYIFHMKNENKRPNTGSRLSFESEKLTTPCQISNRQDSIYDHCLMMIGCGKWPAGMRLPSIRKAEKAWGVNRMAIQMAYKKLASQGIVISKSRSGYYVTGQENVHRMSDHRIELENLYRKFSGIITEATGLAPLPVFRYLARLAQIYDEETPRCAFVECTRIQAEAHAGEIIDRLGVSVMPMTVDEISGRRNRIPGHVSVLLTTHFHSAQLKPLSQPGKLEIVAVPVEVSPRLVDLVKDSSDVLLLLESEMQTARTVADDAGRILGRQPLKIKITENIQEALAEMPGSSNTTGAPETFVLLSPHEWNKIDQSWREHPNVQLVPFRIRKEAWDWIADVVGMPLGALG